MRTRTSYFLPYIGCKALSLMSAFSPKLPNDSDAQNLGEDNDVVRDVVNMSVTSNESFIPDKQQSNRDLNC